MIINETLLDDYLSQLEKARAWSPRVISKLETLIRTSDEAALFRVDPVAYAAEKGVSEAEAIALFLHAAKIGLFVMQWQLVCGSCGGVVENLRALADVHAHFICRLCSAENTANLDDYIRVAFTIAEAVRPLRFHHPETLPIDELYLDYHYSRNVLPYSDGRTLKNVLLTTSPFRGFLEPGTIQTFEVMAQPGLLHATNILDSTSVAFLVGPTQAPGPQHVRLVLEEGQFRPLGGEPAPQTITKPDGYLSFINHLSQLASGPVVFEIENKSPRRATAWMIYAGPDFPTEPLRFGPFLSGKQLLTTQTFRDLFRAESVTGVEGLGIKEITFLFTDLKGSTELYDRIGDPQAFFLVRQHFDTLAQVVAREGGAVVKTIGDAVMATFMNPRDALRAALAMHAEIAAFNRNLAAELILKIGLHQGHSIAVTLNDRVDYFGQTVNIAARVQALAGAGEICFTEAAATFPGWRELVGDRPVMMEQAALKGVSATMQVYRLVA